ncbi:MAG: aminopeptidase [Candidatus Atabeyarchaeum deiterrae]
MGSLAQGARNAVRVCMSVRKGEHVLIVSDKPRFEIGNAIKKEAEAVSPGNVEIYVLEDYCSRPMSDLPDKIATKIPWANVTFWATEAMKGEVTGRMQFLRTALKYARHGHMPNITRQIMEDAMCADYNEVYRVTMKVNEAVKNTKRIKVTNPAGTNLEVELNPQWRWKPSHGLFHKRGEWGNLPEGEIFTAAYKANGVLVVDLLGDFFDKKYGILTADPLRIKVKDSRADIGGIQCNNQELKKELQAYLKTDENSNRLGETALGTNTFLKKLTGNLLQDEKFPTVHCAFGNPYPDETGATWDSKTHVDCIMIDSNVWIDNKKIMEKGKYLL